MQNFRPIATLATLLFCFVSTQAGAAEIELTIDPGSGLGLIAVEGRIESGDSDRFRKAGAPGLTCRNSGS